MKKILTVLLSVMILTLAFGCDKVEKLQEYTQGDFTIMLPAGVEVSDEDDFEAFFATENYMRLMGLSLRIKIIIFIIAMKIL